MGKITTNKSRKEEIPHIDNHEILSFKNIKKLYFKNLEKEIVKTFNKNINNFFNWGNVRRFYGDISPEAANFRAVYDKDSYEYFYQKTIKTTPFSFCISQECFDDKFLTDFFKYLKPPTDSCRISETFSEKGLGIDELTVIIEDDLVMYYDNCDLNFYFNPEKHLSKNINNKFFWLLRLLNGYTKSSVEKNKIFIVYKGEYGFEKKGFDVKKIDVNIDLNYNDDFKEISNKIIISLNDKLKNGLYILDGETGLGKTTYLRYLASKLNRKIIFISPDMVDYITDPSFISFLMNNSDSILIIEDAEPALQKRNGGTRSGAISNILNLTDGLLSDCLNISIVATFNTKSKVIDEALLREGRLIYSYTFKKLTIEKSKKLLEKLGHKDIEVKEPMSVAQIYNFGKDNNSKIYKENKNKIGF